MKSKLDIISTVNMTREEWLAYRHSGLGASEVGTILGLDHYMSSLELFHYKIGAAARFDIESMSAFMGREQEDLIAKLWQHWDGTEDSMINNFRIGRIVRRCQRVNGFVRNPDYPWLYVSLDRKINKQGNKGEGTLEVKTISGYEADKWEAGIPPKYVTQVQTQMLVPEFDWGEMAVMEDGRRMSVLPFERSDGIIQHIVVKTKDFWDRVQKGRKLVNEIYHANMNFNAKRAQEAQAEIDAIAPEPDGTLAYTQYLSEKYNKPRHPDRRGTEEERLEAVAMLNIAEQIKDLEGELGLHESRIKAAMKDHEILDFGAGGKVYWTPNRYGTRTFRNRVNI